MKRLVFCLMLIIVSSCSTFDTSRIAPGYSQAYTSIKNVVFGYQNEISPNLIANIPYASMLMSIGNGPSGLMILEKVVDDKYYWVSADGVYLVTQEGRIVKTHGLGNNLQERLSSFDRWNDQIYDQKFISYYSFINPDLSNLKVESTYTFKGKADLQLTFETHNLRSVEEKIYSSEVGWNETNVYWIDEEGLVWKSVQNISPILPAIYLEITKKPR